MADSFGTYCYRLIGQYNDNWKRLVEESTEIIFTNVINSSNSRIKWSIKNELIVGKFYIIQYNYNGNKIWCPIFVIDDRYNTEYQKRIIYAINLDYLPYKYKIEYFDKLFKSFSEIINKNRIVIDNGNTVNDEHRLKVNFESIYQSLKTNGGFNFSITAFDYTKIVGIDKGDGKIFGISTTILNRFIFIDTKIVNKKLIIDAIKESDIEKEKEKLSEILLMLENSILEYDKDVKEYYQKLKLIENHYKLYENLK